MRRWLGALAVAVLCVVPVGADLTVTSTSTIEGAMAGAGGVVPKIVTYIKGSKSRTDVEVGDQTTTTIVDFGTQQVIVLQPAEKTARIVDAAAALGRAPANMPKIEASVTPTGRTRELNGAACDEYALSIKLDLASMASGANPGMPPEAAAMVKDMRMSMTGSTWVAKSAPGAAEYLAFQKSAAHNALAALAKGTPGMPAGMERLISGFPEAAGIPYLTELTMAIEGSGQMAALMKGMGEMKLTSRVTGVSTEPLADALFEIPQGYTVVKQ